MMKYLLTVLSLCLSTMAIQAQTWDCDCEDTDWDSEGICIQVAFSDSTATSDTLVNFETWVPSECFAECWGFTDYVVVECDTTNSDWEWDDEFDDGVTDWIDYECDCPESDLDGEGICIEVSIPDSILLESGIDSLFGEITSFQTWVPSECYAACCGFTDYVIIDCDSIFNDDWDWGDDWGEEWDDGCECEETDFEDEGICIEVTYSDTLFGETELDSLFGENLTFQTWVPSECYAACWGYTNYVLVDCDSLYNDEWEEEEWDDGCECEESDFEGEGICIEVTFSDTLFGGTELDSLFGEEFTYQTWVPSECYAVCWGYTDFVVIDCDSLYNDEWEEEEWDDGCECEESDLEGEGICIEVTYSDTLFGGIELDSLFGEELTYQTWVPSECYATCWGYTDFVVIDCDSIYNEEEWDDGCECDESDLEGEGICIEVTFPDSIIDILGGVFEEGATFETWVPSECYAACYGYTDYVIVDCDSLFNGGGFNGELDLDSLNVVWDECECEFLETDVPVCVLTNATTGEICPFPNMCYAECAGYTAEDVVDCEEMISFTCVECIYEEINPVCVQDSSGNVFPVPNQCFADCLGLTVVPEGCGDMINGAEVSGSEIISPAIITYEVAEGSNGTVSGYRLYPNPVVDEISLDLELTISSNVTVSITNANGQVVKSQFTTLSKGANNLQFAVNDLSAGLYTISVYNEQRLLSKRFIKQ